MTALRRAMKGRPAGMVLILAFAAGLAAQSPAPLDVAFDQFFAAESPADAAAAADQLVAAGVDFETAYARLKKGRFYGDEKRGEYALRWKSKSGPFFNNIVDVPADYDPAKAWQLRVQLHGGIGRPSPNPPSPKGLRRASRSRDSRREPATASRARSRSTCIPAAGPLRSGGMKSRSITSSAASIR